LNTLNVNSLNLLSDKFTETNQNGDKSQLPQKAPRDGGFEFDFMCARPLY